MDLEIEFTYYPGNRGSSRDPEGPDIILTDIKDRNGKDVWKKLSSKTISNIMEKCYEYGACSGMYGY